MRKAHSREQCNNAAAFTGGGAFSLDAKFGFTFFGELYFVEGVLLFAVIAAALALALRPNRDGRSLYQER